MADVATKQRQTYLRNLEALLAVELEERERNTIARRIKDARLPRMMTLDDFDFSKAPQVPPTKIHELAGGGYIERAEPVIRAMQAYERGGGSAVAVPIVDRPLSSGRQLSAEQEKKIQQLL